MVDIDEFRESYIRMYGLTKTNKSYTFYHDETNNTASCMLMLGA